MINENAKKFIMTNPYINLNLEQKTYLLQEFLGDFLYCTTNRAIFESKSNKDKIIKLQLTLPFIQETNQNKLECNIIEYLSKENPDLKKWFADISFSLFDKIVIEQERTNSLFSFSELPNKLPTFCAGAELNCFGYRKGFVVLQHFSFIPIERVEYYNGEFLLKENLSNYDEVHIKPQEDNNYLPNPILLTKAVESFTI